MTYERQTVHIPEMAMFNLSSVFITAFDIELKHHEPIYMVKPVRPLTDGSD